MSTITPETMAAALRTNAEDGSLWIDVIGFSMEPAIVSGSRVRIAASTKPRKGEIWAFCAPDGEVVVHRCRGRRSGRWMFVADNGPRRDPLVTDARLIGKVVEVEAPSKTLIPDDAFRNLPENRAGSDPHAVRTAGHRPSQGDQGQLAGQQQQLQLQQRRGHAVAPAATDTPWAAAAQWSDGRVRRQVRFVPSGAALLYTSAYEPARARARFSMLVCPSWGTEGRYSLEWCHGFARDVTSLGGRAVVVHWPGFEDSTGDPDDVSLASMIDACTDVAAHGWAMAGFGVGAAAVAVAAERLASPYLVLVEPQLDPGAHFAALARSYRRVSLGQVDASRWVFGAPVPDGLRDDDGASVREALAARTAHGGPTLVLRSRDGLASRPTDGVTLVEVAGNGRGDRYLDRLPLRRLGVKWLRRELRRTPPTS